MLIQIALFLSFAASAAPRVELFSPQGAVKGVRQVTARFSESMIAFGDPRPKGDPFWNDCPAKGAGRWIDATNWSWDFEKDLPAGLICRFTLREGLETLDGDKVGGEREFSFTTGGPAIVRTQLWEGAGIAEDQLFAVELDAPAVEASIVEHAYFEVEGIIERVGIRLVSGPERESLLRAIHWEDRPQVLLLAARRNFPSGARVRLVWGKGIAALAGAATEQEQALVFKARDPFTAGFTCERPEADAGCIPFLPVSLRFTAPLAAATARKITLKNGKGRAWKARLPRDEEEGGDFTTLVQFDGPFPAETELTVHLPPAVVDDSGRTLANAGKFPLPIRMGGYPPLAKFPASFGILELKASPVLPVTLRAVETPVRARLLNVAGGPRDAQGLLGKVFRAEAPNAKNILFWLSQAAEYPREKTMVAAGRPITVPKPNGAKAFEVVGIPLNDPGFYLVELESPLLGKSLLEQDGPMYVRTAALVTNLAVHFKWGRESSLVWVTALDSGLPVPNAEITVADCEGKTLWEGKTMADGLARAAALPKPDALPGSCRGYGTLNGKMIVMARAGGDLSFALDSWGEGLEPWRFQVDYDYYRAEPLLRRSTVLSRSLLRAGETLHMKHFIRREGMSGFGLPDPERWPRQLYVKHWGSNERFDLPLQWRPDGTAESVWTVPAEAKLGNYGIVIRDAGRELTADEEYESARGEEIAGGFRVEEFRVPLLKASLQGPAGDLVGAESVPLTALVKYLSGGGFSGQAVKLRAEARRGPSPTFERFEGFSFGNGGADQERGGLKLPAIPTRDIVLDGAGSARAEVSVPAAPIPLELAAELEFRDPNGETQTASARVPVWPSAVLVGLKRDSWSNAKDTLKFQAAAATLRGKPAPGTAIAVFLKERRVTSRRKRLVGGFYSYEHSEALVEHGKICEGLADAQGLVFCEAKSPVSGNVILEARVADAAGRASVAHQSLWVSGRDDWWFEVGDSDRIDLVPERRRYEPGQTAQLQVRMPFREATALVTVEREGVVDAYVRRLSGKAPLIRVPIKGNYAPNAFVSAFVVRGRAAGVKPTALVDLGRPAFRMGLTELTVGWKAHELKVAVTPDRTVYKVREKAKIKLAVKTADGRPLPAGAEVAVAAVDEGLLELMPNKTWDLLSNMMGRRSLSVRTFTAQTHVVGKRHFGLKALPTGGGGGRDTARELFDTLLLWKGRVPLDAKGEAELEIPLNDSATGFRIEAVASAGTDRFGGGGASIRSTQDLMLLPGVPPLAREGDRFTAAFTARNTTDKPMDLELAGQVEGLTEPLKGVSLNLPAGKAEEVSWEVSAPAGRGHLVFTISAKDKLNGAEDKVRIKQKLLPAVPVRVLQATLAQVDGSLKQQVRIPEDALPGRGGIEVLLRPSLSGGAVTSLARYMADYPFSCLEQKTSKAVALRDAQMWRKAMEALPSYLDGDGLAKYFPLMLRGSDALTAYLVSVAHEAGWEIPEGSLGRMLDGLAGFVEGRVQRDSSLPTADVAVRKIAALEALSRHGRAKPEMLQSLPPDPNLWPTSAVLDWLTLNRRLGAQERVEAADRILRSRLNLQGTTMGFSTEGTDALWWLMVSNDLNAVKHLLAQLEAPSWREDIPRLVRGALGRQRHGHWDLTTANAWGRLALEKFAAKFEKEAVSGTTRLELGDGSDSLDWSRATGGDDRTLAWPAGKAELKLSHRGDGKPWVTVQSRAAVPLKEPFSSGYRLKKTVTPVQQAKPGRWSRGDIARVRLEVNAQSDMTWVVVSDPIPAGAALLGTGLGRDSALSTRGERDSGWVWPAFEERSLEAFRAYYEFVPKGDFAVEYTVRLNNPGYFGLPPTRAEAMYSPEMLGELPNASWEVLP